MRIWSGLLLMLLLLTGYGLGYFTGPKLTDYLNPSTDPNSASKVTEKAEAVISCVGKIQPADGVLSLIGIPGDRAEKFHVQQGDKVEKDQQLLTFASHADRKAELDLILSQIQEAEALQGALALAKTAKVQELGIKKNLGDMKYKLDESLLKEKIASLDLRYKSLQSQFQSLRDLNPLIADVPRQEMQKAEVGVSAALTELKSAKLSQEEARKMQQEEAKSLVELEKGAKAEFEVSRNRIPLDSLRQQEKLAKLRLDRAILKAPAAGRVLRLLISEGDSVGQEPVLQIAAGSKMVVLAEVYVDEISKLVNWLQPGQQVKVTVQAKALKGMVAQLTGTVSDRKAIANVVAPNRLKGFDPRGEADRRVVEVRVDLDDEYKEIAAHFIGLEVECTFTKPIGSKP